MASDKVMAIINVSLGLIAVLLLINLFGVELPSLGQAKLFLDKEEPVCVVNWKEDYSLWGDIDSCCLEVRKQLGCELVVEGLEDWDVDWVCKTGEGKVLKYWLNDKAYNYCQQSVIW
ncbi:hypothetical protein HOC13_02140 [Candidatus Woesearchaeota archaeon]|jgi:hypothetical protein|nr:hypothetical protein [Candidatus Woesearchaeota archaeon]